MKTFSEKVCQSRAMLDLTQQELADRVRVSKRSIASYESGGAKPRGAVAYRLASALSVTTDYLLNDEIDDPAQGAENEPYIAEARARYGSAGADEARALLEQNAALFAGGALDQDAKDAFFEAVMKAYLECKEEARARYGKKSER